jgi:hypothetical protein
MHSWLIRPDHGSNVFMLALARTPTPTHILILLREQGDLSHKQQRKAPY